jgi:hypothetical protein
MVYKAFLCLAALCLLTSLSVSVCAQTPGVVVKSASVTKEPRGKGPLSKSHEPSVAQAQREHAVSLVRSIADEADTFKDQTLRVQVQARAADALWDSDSISAVSPGVGRGR